MLRSNGDSLLLVKGSRVGVLIEHVNELMGSAPQSPEEAAGLTVYLYIDCRSSRIVSFMSARPIQEAVLRDPAGNVARHIAKAMWEVSRIWTCPKHRCRGLARFLLGNLRKCSHQAPVLCSPDCCAARDEIAFSQPTSSGRLLAQKILNDHDHYLCTR